jgi:glutaredoxin-like protein NrdH
MTKRTRPMLYTLSTCVHCAATKRFLREHGIEYDYVDVDTLEGEKSEKIRDEVLKVSGGFRFPTIVVGKKVIVGFHEDKLRKALGL